MLHLKPGETALDLGSGLGPATVKMSSLVGPSGSVIAVDPSGLLRGIMRMRLAALRLRNVRQVKGTAESLPIQSGRVHAVASMNVIHHMRDFGQAVKELYRVLVDDGAGRLQLIDEDFANPQHSQHALHQSFHEHFVTPATDEMVRLLSEAGFRAPAVARKVAGGEPALVVTATK